MQSFSKSAPGALRTLRVAVDIGGTFTDLVAADNDGRLAFGKSLSTHDHLVRGILDTADEAGVAFADVEIFLHGSTIAINTLLERTGAETALLVTEGFRDIYEIGRINRPQAYDLFFRKHEPLVHRSLRFEVAERLRADGSIHVPLDENRVRVTARDLRERGIESIAILLLHSYCNAAHERRVAEIMTEELPNAFITASHELTQEYREFERISTVAANAYIGPRVSTYLGEIEQRLTQGGFKGDFFAVQSTGGLLPVVDAQRQCVRMLESGPAAGVVGTQALCRRLGFRDAIAFDMGGTTAKAGVILDGKPLTTGSALIGAYQSALPIQIPMIDIFEVGTGGGSVAWLAPGNALRVGPRSAGSAPGPACYGRGGSDPTVTDANLVLGRLDAEHFLGGSMVLDPAAAERALINIASPLGLSAIEAADGIIRIAVTAMSYAVKGVTIDRGLDASTFVLVVYGGAGPLHATEIARELGISRVLIPYAPGHFSAYGMLFGDIRYDYVRSGFTSVAMIDWDELRDRFGNLEAEGREAVTRTGVGADRVTVERFADMRYIGQEHAVTVAVDHDALRTGNGVAIKAAFDGDHLRRYGTSSPDEGIELVSIRVSVFGQLPVSAAVAHAPPSTARFEAVRDREVPVYFEKAGFVVTPVYQRALLLTGTRIAGPAKIEEHASTTILHPGDVLTVDIDGNLDIEVGELA